MKYTKPAVPIQDQVIKLRKRGLSITDDAIAERYLTNISFYRLRAYTYPYQNNKDANHPFIGNVSFDQIIDLYNFDRKLRLMVFNAIEKIEIALRTQVIYHWSLSNGSHWHLDKNLYKNETKFIKHLASLQKEIDRSNETFIDHYKQKYSSPSDPPCWMSLELTSIGLLSLIFQNLKNGVQKKAVTHHFGLLSTKVLENWIHNFCNIRNICAHHGRLWNRRLTTHIKIPTDTKNQFITEKHVYPYKVYAALCCMKYILDIISPNHTFTIQLLELMKTCPLAQEKEMGFPTDWKQENFWQI